MINAWPAAITINDYKVCMSSNEEVIHTYLLERPFWRWGEDDRFGRLRRRIFLTISAVGSIVVDCASHTWPIDCGVGTTAHTVGALIGRVE